MYMKKLFCALMLLVPLQLFCQQIQQSDVDRVMKTLSDDAMEGRSCFTPGIEKAAQFIAQEFTSAGLKPLTGDADFFQSFPVYQLVPESAEVTINERVVPAENIFAITNYEFLQWNSSASITVRYIAAADNFRKSMSAIQDIENDRLVLIAPAHQKTFERYKNFFGKGGVERKLNEGHSLVAVMIDSVNVNTFSVQIKNSVATKTLANIVGMIPGEREKEKVIFSAHYDHLGIRKPVDGDSIANGADDDASGTTAVMMLAKYFKSLPQPERTLIFVAFTAEEIGGFGSKYFSEQMNPEEIVAMFNIEMIGTPSKFGPNTAWITGFDMSTFGTILQKSLQNTGSSVYPDPYPEQNLFYRSDNATLAKLGVPAHSISSSQIDIDKNYHTVNDEYETLDIPHMTNIIKAIALSAKGIVSGTETPTRIDLKKEK
jgi:hypothetical protein